jgi:hypothetical protein
MPGSGVKEFSSVLWDLRTTLSQAMGHTPFSCRRLEMVAMQIVNADGDLASKKLNIDTINNSEHNNIYPKKLSSEHRMTEILQTFCITH